MERINAAAALKQICDGKTVRDEDFYKYDLVQDEDTMKHFEEGDLIYKHGKSYGDVISFDEFLETESTFEIAHCICNIPLIYSALETKCKRCGLDIQQ